MIEKEAIGAEETCPALTINKVRFPTDGAGKCRDSSVAQESILGMRRWTAFRILALLGEFHLQQFRFDDEHRGLAALTSTRSHFDHPDCLAAPEYHPWLLSVRNSISVLSLGHCPKDHTWHVFSHHPGS